MASLSSPFILCPLPDRKALLGIRPDCLQHKAIVTLGKNIAIRYHVLEQKQESSWTTSRYWFTSPVMYCYDFGKYGAVLNHNIIALWEEGDASLANIQKVKLPFNAFDLHCNPNGRTIIVLENGCAAYLNDFFRDNKHLAQNDAILDPDETLVSFEVDEKTDSCYLVARKDTLGKQLTVIQTVIENQVMSSTRNLVGNRDEEMLGFCLLTAGEDNCFVHYSTDGCIYKQRLQKDNNFESVKLAGLQNYVSYRNPVIMCALQNNSSIAIYGCDPSEEGAVVIIYDIHYDIVVSKQSLKLYSVPPLMEKIDQSLFVPLGLHILVLGFRITKSLLSSVVGKHQAKLNEEVFEGRNPWVETGWDPDSQSLNGSRVSDDEKISKDKEIAAMKKAYPNIWETIQQVKIFESEGQPESIICNHVVPSAIEKNNAEALDWILDTFVDIPEVHIVSMVVYSLRESSLLQETSKMDNRLKKLLVRKFDKSLLICSLRHVDYDVAKELLQHINLLIKNQWQWRFNTEDEDDDSMKYWLKWCSALLDAHYTKFVLHSDTSIVENLLENISQCTSVLEAVAEMEPFLALTYSKTLFEPTSDPVSKWRTETITFE